MDYNVAVLRTIGPVTKDVHPKDWLFDTERGIEPGKKEWPLKGLNIRGIAVNRAKKGHMVVAVVQGCLPGITPEFVVLARGKMA